ncbi:MAG: hypothetical protein AB1563_10480 [Bacillota bacterium]
MHRIEYVRGPTIALFELAEFLCRVFYGIVTSDYHPHHLRATAPI